MKRRILSIITALALCLSLCPTWAFATEADPALCRHHPAHTGECGYIAPTEGQPCGHQHTAECYTLGVLPDVDGGDPYEVGADTENLLDCQHTHDSECGYAQADPGQPCGYECRICPIEDLIAALPDKVTEDNAEDVRGQLDEILALFSVLTADEQEQIDLSRCYELQGALDGANDPAPITESVEYQEASWDGSQVTYESKTETCTLVENSAEAVTWTAGWYAVSGTVTIDQPITVNGEVHLILADGCTLTAAKGIVVTDGNSLTIYAQSKNGGTLNATGTTDDSGNASAGIGGSTSSFDSGSITIYGGIINATGGVANNNFGNPNYGGAGIGGSTTSSGNGGNSGTIEIYGGTITANSGAGNLTGAGIGGGAGDNGGGAGSNITIYGGSVTAASTGTRLGGAGIGGGGSNKDGGTGENINIYGGTVNATGGNLGAGIGGGGSSAIDDSSHKSGDGAVTISGGIVTAVGGTNAAGIGGGGGYYSSYTWGGMTYGSGCTGGTGSVTITGGIVDAKGGAGNSSGDYAGAPIGNGGNTTATATVSKTNAIVFENGAGTVCGDVTLDGSYTVPGDYTLNIPLGASLSGSGTLSGGNAFTTENLTEDMISVPTNLYYNGEDRTADITTELSGELDKGITICGQTFTVSGWTLAVAKTDDLTYTATYTNNNDNTNTFTKTITLQQSGTDLTDGKVKTYKDGAECSDFTASDTIKVIATPTATGKAPDNSAMFAASFTAPGAGQMAVFVGDTQVSEPVDAVDGTYTMEVSASVVLLAAGGPGTEISLTAKFVGNDNMADGQGTATVSISAVAKAERGGTLLGYYGESGLDAAFVNSGNAGATFTLLANVERTSILSISISCTLDLNGKTIHSTGQYESVLSISSGATVTIRGDGTVTSEHGNGLSVSGTATLEGGNFISGAADYGGVNVRGKLIVTGKNVVMRNTGNGNGLSVNSGTGATAQLSAGTYGGGTAAIEIYQGTGTLAGLLNQEGASRVAFYKDNTTLVTEGLDGQALPSGSYTVKACTHIFGSSPTCLACGEQAVARVTIGDAVTHYGDLPSAWAAVQGQTADLYLLKSVDAAGVGTRGRLDLASGSVTLGMADGVVLSGSSNQVIKMIGGELTLNSGTIRNNGTTTIPTGLQVSDGTLRVSGGTVEANWAVYINGGHAEITGGTFTATGNYSVGLRKDEGTVKISGGQFSGSLYAVYNSNGTLADLLAEDYAFKQGGAWVTDTSGDSLTGTVTAEPAPVKITAQPVNTSQRYGDMDALSIETSPGQDELVTYQWYVVKASGAEAVSGKIAPVFSPSENQRLDVGSYQYFCEVTKDSYTLRSNTVTFTVTPRQVDPSITGDATKAYDGTTDVASGQLSITLTGVLEGDTVTATASYAYDNANAGENKTITASGITLEGGSKDNYTLSSTTATTTGTITKSQPTIAFADGYNPSKDYDGQTIPNPTADDLTITGANFSDVTFAWSATPRDAGTYTLTANIKETPNTAAASTSPLTVTINKATLTATGATVASKTYDTTKTATVSGVTFTGLVNGETLALGQDYAAAGSYDDPNAGENKSATILVELKSSAKANNYNLTNSSVNATGTITKASSSITTAPSATGITYGQALSASTLTGGTGSVPGAFAWTDSTAKPNAGTAQFEVTFTPTDTNYNSTTTNVSVTVAKATPTLTAPTATAIQYGQKLTDSALTGGTATNPNGSAAVAGTWSWASGSTRPTATGAFPVAFVPGDTANYNTPENVDTSVTVNPAAPKLTLTVPAYQVAGGEVTVTCKVENPHDATFKEGIPEAVTLTYTIGGETKPVDTDGKFTIPTGTAKDTVITITAITAAVDGKYTAATKTATVSVTDKIPVEINGISVAGRVYNGQPVSYTGTLTVKKLDGTVVTDAPITYTWSSGVAPVNAGDYSLVIAVGGDKYIGSTTVDFTIGKASVTITAASKSAVVGSTKPELTYTVAGLANGDTLATVPTLTCDADMNTVGSYPITASGAAVPNTSNYNPEITYVAGTLTVTAKPSNNGGGNNYTPSTPSSPTVTVPVSGDKSTVHVSASVSGTTATVSKIDTSQIENVIGDNGQASMVEIDFTGLGKTIDTVKLPAAAIKDIAAKAQNKEVGGLTVKLPEAEISFDANALSAIQAQAGSQITLTLTPAKPADLNNRQKEAAGSAPVFDLTLRSSSGAITDFRGGYATVSLPYTLAAGQNPSGVVVYYLDSTGNITPCATMYDVRSKSAIFTTGHLSLYFVGYDPAAVWVNPFSDVAEGAWYYDAVRYASENGLMGGYGNGRFGPNDNLSRAQFAQILFNKEGRPVVNYLLQYGDVATGAWYTEAIRWATSQGVVGGYGNGMFGPNDNITREQLAVMLWRYAGSPAATDKELHFTDADKASGYALEALRWAVENGILNGYGDGRLGPQGQATRAQVAQMLKNFIEGQEANT